MKVKIFAEASFSEQMKTEVEQKQCSIKNAPAQLQLVAAHHNPLRFRFYYRYQLIILPSHTAFVNFQNQAKPEEKVKKTVDICRRGHYNNRAKKKQARYPPSSPGSKMARRVKM